MDFSYLISISDGDKEFIKEFISTFESNTNTILSKMREAQAQKDYDALKRLAHQIKPSFEMLHMKSHDLSVKAQQDPRSLEVQDVDFMENECRTAVSSMKNSFNG